jgi:5-formyltetrahydrofolate cyclo-ligase
MRVGREVPVEPPPGGSPGEPTPTKLALRRTVKAGRRARDQVERDHVAGATAAVALEMPQIRAARCVTVYASLPDEPGTDRLRAGLRGLGIRVLLPVVPDQPDQPDQPGRRALDWAIDEMELAPSGPLDLPEPIGARLGPASIADAQVVIVPALAVDTAGTRLGRGRGYYDSALTRAAGTALILALVHDEELLDARTTPIPREGHDIAVHGVITPTRWMFFSPSRG